MAVSLVSTGVQFPDSSIQTTAATAGPSATALGAVVLTAAAAGTDSFNTIYTTFGSNNLFTTPLTAVTSSFSAVTAQTSGLNPAIMSMSYSSYYGLWFGIAGGSNTLAASYSGAPVVSADGLHWTPVLTAYTLSTAPFTYMILSIGVNDSNGNIYLMSASNTTTFYIYESTDAGVSWTQVYANAAAWRADYAAQSTFRYLNTGTASTSKSVFTIGYNTNAAVVVAPGNSNTFSVVSASGPGSYVGDVRPAAVATYGTIMWYRHCDTGAAIYNAATGSLTNTTLLSLYVIGTSARKVQMAINNSYYIGPSATAQGYISYGTISDATPTYAGQVLLPKNTSAVFDPAIMSCVYDGTRWMAITDQGLYYTANANPSSGWVKAPMTRGVINQGAASTYGYSLNQRDPIR